MVRGSHQPLWGDNGENCHDPEILDRIASRPHRRGGVAVAAPPSGVSGGLRLAELLATVSLASDLAHDVPSESALRDAILAVRLARLAGWPDGDVSDAYYLALLYHVGCTGAVDIQSRFGGGVVTLSWPRSSGLPGLWRWSRPSYMASSLAAKAVGITDARPGLVRALYRERSGQLSATRSS